MMRVGIGADDRRRREKRANGAGRDERVRYDEHDRRK